MSSHEVPEKFTGYQSMNKEHWQDLEKHEYSPKKFTDDDVTMKIDFCGVCGSDIHTISSGWGPCPYPLVTGHELVGTLVRKGKNVTHLEVGDRIGLGAQSGSCGKCDSCNSQLEQFCNSMLGTYGAKWEDGSVSQGGYANYNTARGHFFVKIPEGIKSEEAGPLMCAGITTYSPLKHMKVGKGDKVGIIGVGGLGHLGVQWAAAFGAEVSVISHSDNKKEIAQKLGAKHFISFGDKEKALKEHAQTFDKILCTTFMDDMPLSSFFMKLLKPRGQIMVVGLPETGLPKMSGMDFVAKGYSLSGSLIGSPSEISEMLEFAAKNDIKPMIEVRPIKDSPQVMRDMEAGKARFRYVLDCREI